MTTLAATIAIVVAGKYSNTLDIGSVDYPLNFAPNVNFTDGAGAGQASKVWSDTRTLAASATEDLDLNGTALVDAFGNALALTKGKVLIVTADVGNVNDVVVGGAASNAWATMFGSATDKVKVRPGGFLVLADPSAGGYTVTPTTGDLLRIGNGGAGTPVTYTIEIFGA